ncbi:hypothetical protein TNIN_293891 [Trichonephila inaurata madagascariensis]|uniref:Uncharacterized protein n=1 Tax=Trichonephila inaurata madagascariensis TaxID=2747483 RepID=A0A8X7C1K4_9ARAC|nr:hypothetical protein TNIN_293891 [Trichonephila inaurata madagascariensis]
MVGSGKNTSKQIQKELFHIKINTFFDEISEIEAGHKTTRKTKRLDLSDISNELKLRLANPCFRYCSRYDAYSSMIRERTLSTSRMSLSLCLEHSNALRL